jgi:DNA-binding CsgD family transcriptional regulator
VPNLFQNSPTPTAYAFCVSTVVGRESEIGVVEAFLAAADRGVAMLAIAGEPGIGKTGLWEEVVRRARERGAIVLVSRPTESEAKLSFAGLTDLLAGVGPEAFADLPPPQRSALEVALLRVEAGRPPEPRTVGTGLLSLLRRLSVDSVVVLAVDDMHWLDPPSAAAVEFAIRRLVEEPVGLVGSVRSEAARTGLAGRLPESHLQRIELGPLSVAALHRIVVQQLGGTLPRPTLVRLARASGGNPLHVLEIARLLAQGGGRPAEALPVPEDLRALVAGRVRSLPAETRTALLRVAALARPDLRLVDARALAAAEEAGLVRIGIDRRIEFVHPLFASAVYASAPMSRRRETHRALAGEVSDPEERARHLALACEGQDEAVAREVESAARRARRRGAPDTAAELTELALRLTPEGSPATGRLRLALAEHLQFAGDFHRAAGLLEELRQELEPGDLLARVLLALAEIDYWRTGESAAVALAEEALLVARHPLVQARSQTSIAQYAGTVDLPKAAAAARTALAFLESGAEPDPGLVAVALSARVRADLFLGRGFDAEAAERALSLEERAPPAAVDTRVVFKLSQWLRYADDFDGSRARLVQVERAAREEGDESSLPNILLNRVVLECWAGRWGEAAELARRMSEAFEQSGVQAGGRVWQAYVDAHLGRLEAVRAAEEQARPCEPIVEMIWSRCLGLAELAAGETEAAERHLSAAMAEIDRVDFREPAIWRVDGDAIEAVVGVGDLARAAELVARFEQRAEQSRIPWSLAVSARCRGLALAVGGQLEAGAEALDRALIQHERCPVPFELARTLLVQGQILRRLKQRRRARVALEQAVGIFERLGAELWADRAREELQRAAVRQAPAELSPTELRVARLAASGLTNVEIAAEVFLSRKAVEANLARAYRKLGIRSRAQLARALDARAS